MSLTLDTLFGSESRRAVGQGRQAVDEAQFVALLLALIVAAIAVYGLMLPMVSGDMQNDLLSWYAAVQQGGTAALSGAVADYTPPYIYMLWLTTLLPAGIGPVAAIKLVSIVFTIVAAMIFAGLVRDITGQKRLALLAGCAFPLLPTVAVNAAWWGQCDIIYTSFLLGCFRATLHRRPGLAMLLFGVAISIKLQSIFLAPYLAVLLLRREIPWRYLVLPPLVYAVLMVPAWLAGRPALELAGIYLFQGGKWHSLAMGAPNFWTLAQNLPFVHYNMGLVAGGLLVTVVAFLVVLARAVPSHDGSVEFRVLLAVSCLLLAPFLLPKMHDRYFFPADVFSLLLLFVPLRLKPVPVLLQAASLSVYVVALTPSHSLLFKGQGMLAATLAVAFVGWEFIRRTARPTAAAEFRTS